METSAQMKAYRPSGRVSAASRALGAPSGPHPNPQQEHEQASKNAYNKRFPGTNVLNPGLPRGELQRIEQLIANATKSRTQAELQPFKARGQEIQGTEQTVAKRYGGIGEQTQGTLTNLVGQSEAGAKTAENQAAEATLAANKAIESTGQTNQTLNAGYLDSQVRAAQEAAKANVAGIGASAQAGAQARGQGEEAFMRELRGVASQRALEGQGNIASLYGKQLTQNRGKEGEVLARNQAREKEERLTLPRELLTQKLGVQKLANEGIKVQQGGEKIRATERGQNLNRASAQERAGVTIRGQNIQKWAKEADLNYKVSHPSGKSTNAPKAPSPAEGRKYQAKISTAESLARALLPGGPRSTRPQQEAAREELRKKGATGDLISAALNLVVYGRLGPQDRRTAEAYGLTRQMRPQWFR